MKKGLILVVSILFLSIHGLSAQIGFHAGTDFEFMKRKSPSESNADAFGAGSYFGFIYGIPASMSSSVNVGLNYKFHLLWRAGAWDDNSKLDPLTLSNCDTGIKEHHLQLPVTYFRHLGSKFTFSAGPVLDYCLSSKVSSDSDSWSFKDKNGKNKDVDAIKDLGIKPFNVYLKAGIGSGSKNFSFSLTASYGLLDLSPDATSLPRWTLGMDIHFIF